VILLPGVDHEETRCPNSAGCLASLEIVTRRTGVTELLIGDPNQIPAAVTP
jgi:hypothetical protein